MLPLPGFAVGRGGFGSRPVCGGDQYYNQQALSTINALSAYTQGYSGSGVTIGVVDSGLDPNHIAFSGALVGAMGWSARIPQTFWSTIGSVRPATATLPAS